jgi:hypothetical protein
MDYFVFNGKGSDNGYLKLKIDKIEDTVVENSNTIEVLVRLYKVNYSGSILEITEQDLYDITSWLLSSSKDYRPFYINGYVYYATFSKAKFESEEEWLSHVDEGYITLKLKMVKNKFSPILVVENTILTTKTFEIKNSGIKILKPSLYIDLWDNTTNVTIKNTTTNATINFTNLNKGEQLRINNRGFIESLVDENRTISYTGILISLGLGNNNIQITSNGKVKVSIQWQNVYDLGRWF